MTILPHKRRRCWLRVWPLVIAAAVAAGCASDKAARREAANFGQTHLKVLSFEISGADHFEADTIKQGLATREDPGWRAGISWVPLLGAEHRYFNRIEWRRDIKRIKTFYKKRGYFGARIVKKDLIESPERGGVRIRLKISEGQPTRVESVDLEGLSGLDDKARRLVPKNLPLKQGQIFSESDYLNTRKMLGDRMRGQSYAYAEISGRAIIDPSAHTARVHYYLDPGPSALFGEIHIVGNDEIETRFVRTAIPFEPGQAYSEDLVRQTQTDIYDLGVFSLVSVLPAHQASDKVLEAAGISPKNVVQDQGIDGQSAGQGQPDNQPPDTDNGPSPADSSVHHDIRQASQTSAGPMGISEVLASAQQQAESRSQLDRRVPMIIRLKESRLWNVEAGVGVSVGSNRTDLHGQLNWSSRNFFGGLRKLDHTNSLGYAWAANDNASGLGGPFIPGQAQSEAANEGVFLDSLLEFRQPQFLERKTTLRTTARLRRGIEVGYSVWNPSGSIGLQRDFLGDLTLGASYHLSYYSYENVGDALLTAPGLGVDFDRQYLLEWLEQQIALDLRDNPINPESGVYSALSVQEAGSYVAGGDFQFLKVIWRNEGYVPVDFLTRWVFAGRIKLGTIYNQESVNRTDTGDRRADLIPIESRLYGGGASGLRGLGHNNLSFFRVGDFNPTSPDDIDTVEVIPIGGLTLAEASIESRFQLVDNLAGVGPLWGLVYYDLGTILDDQFLFSTAASKSLGIGTADVNDLTTDLISAVGVGSFWLTPVGPVQFDFAVTLNDLSNDPRFRTCGPTSRVRTQTSQTGRTNCQLLPKQRDPVQQQINLDYSFFIGVGHSF